MKATPDVGRLRGKTCAGRLGLWDALCQALFADECALGVVDVGIGERADTTLDLLDWLDAPVTALEVHPRRAELARQTLAGHPVRVLEVDPLTTASRHPVGGLLRCANVLRQYPVAGVDRAHLGLSAWVHEGGVVLEGSCDKAGHVGAFHILRRSGSGPIREALAFVTDFERGFAPIQLRDHLPRDLRREARDGGCMTVWFDRWTDAWQSTRTGSPRADFVAAAQLLGDDVQLVVFEGLERSGAALVWRPLDGVPRPTKGPWSGGQ